MRLTAKFLLLALACGHGGVTLADDQDAAVQRAARDLMQEYRIPGLAIAITAHGEQRFYNFGVASKESGQQVTQDTLFEVGSVSKTLTATLAGYAQANGRLDLGANPVRYLPELAGTALDKVSLINLATHTAGGFPLQLPETVRNQRQLIDYYRAWRPSSAPGTQRTYANPSIGLLGVVAAKSLELPYAKAMETLLLPKLGMPNTYIEVPASAMPRYAQGYDKADAPVRVNPAPLAAEAYGVKTSSKDLLRFVEAQLGQGGLDGKVEQAIAATRTGYFKVGDMTQALIWEQYSYPVALDTLLRGNGSQMVLESHPVSAIVPPLAPQKEVWVNKTGSTNGFGAYVAFVPSRGVGIVLLANRNYPNEERVRLAYRILAELD
ncbi:class C beta-lactamase [Metapseudomonas resinovorans]|uniref:Beta-lactamase n=1 Tax=Metapseudomonas resinovorans NBRC 106553 TaxID=1245471 RepID=S6AW64_METRE|nr:class C beta-lactamase [Pseudomonas resinovorans]BAN48786.1 beta-lactamase [Pseudomonas resinovorans NBRC 106553]